MQPRRFNALSGISLERPEVTTANFGEAPQLPPLMATQTPETGQQPSQMSQLGQLGGQAYLRFRPQMLKGGATMGTSGKA